MSRQEKDLSNHRFSIQVFNNSSFMGVEHNLSLRTTMRHMSFWFLSTLNMIVLSFSSLPMGSASNTKASGSATDRLALLSFKSLIHNDPSGALTSWNESSFHFCRWRGVTCGNYSHQLRVTALDLESLNLAGSLSSSLANLTFLQRLQLPGNRLRGQIPHDLGLLSHLRHLNLSHSFVGGMFPDHVFRNCSHLRIVNLEGNNFHGKMASNLSHCSQLKFIALGRNMLEGEIPGDIGSISKLEVLSLGYNNLTGRIPSEIGNLAHLERLFLNDNLLMDTIPFSIGNLTAITLLGLAGNKLGGSIPSSIWNLSLLIGLDVQDNHLGGSLPQYLGKNLHQLHLLYLNDNELQGPLPNSWSGASNLKEILLQNNNFDGTIPPAIGNLSTLTKLHASHNNLGGAIPPSLCNLSSLILLDIQFNHFTGSLPRDFGDNLRSLRRFSGNDNQLHGPLPISWPPNLEELQLNGNNFTGKIPESLGTLQQLLYLQLSRNQLEAKNAADWSFVDALANCTNLIRLVIGYNKLQGVLPRSIVNLSTTLELISFYNNQIAGSIPAEIGNLLGLTVFEITRNHLSGTIPFGLGRIPELAVILMSGNLFTGKIPPSLGNLTSLYELDLSLNELQGPIPPSLRDCPLQILYLQSNKLNGTLPKEILSIPTLTQPLSVTDNFLSGHLPSEIGNLRNIIGFGLGNNQFSGEIPSTIGKCEILQYLYMEYNFFEGSIPSSLSQLKGLEELDLSHNNLSGHIPEFLGKYLNMTYLNLSYNNLEGEVPKEGVFKNLSAFSILGNHRLCGGIPQLNLPPCSNQTTKKKHNLPAKTIAAISVAGGIAVFIVIFSLFAAHCWLRKSRSQSSPFSLIKEQHRKVSYVELLQATDDFSPTNLIGMGSFGSVYKGIANWEDHKDIAVKVLNLQQEGASRSFMAECEALRNIRHRNLVKILTSCSSIDFKGNDFKALIYEYMPNGSVDNWLHPRVDEQGAIRMLSFIQRLNISIDVASALSYLHCHGSVVHCDLKPSNVLLDHDMVAHVGDFGLARFLKKTANKSFHGSTSSVTLKGSIGYAAPEYGMANKVSAQGDVYSYGILLLEMFTGRRPTDGIFMDGLSLHQYVEMALDEQIADIVDPQLLLQQLGREEEAHHLNAMTNGGRGRTLEHIASVLRIGTVCSMESPKERMHMEEVIGELHKIRDAFLSGASDSVQDYE
ncbi:receptor kinase-like protein Xa21 [Canna indica]|uniref:Receptor kinase-like protein Xa21 n=1 Tax=Canna indica TaxID=4628 RepID=A0AAQ3QGT0_9LILI|nr:receptor kinase-like protein Xa21 [Canna indica]